MSAPDLKVPRATEPHLDEAALVRWLDGEIVAEDGDVVSGTVLAAHAAGCPVCTARADVLRARRARLAALLVATDVPAPGLPAYVTAYLGTQAAAPRIPSPRIPPSRVRTLSAPPRRSRWLEPGRVGGRPAVRAVAAAVFVVAAGLSAQPVRRWVSAHLTRAAALPGARPDTAIRSRTPESTVAPSRPEAASVTVAFTPQAGVFTIWFDVRPAGGTLTVRAGPTARATATAAAAGGDLLVLPAGLRVRNAQATRGVYDLALQVPVSTPRVRVRFGESSGDTTLTLVGRRVATLALGGGRDELPAAGESAPHR